MKKAYVQMQLREAVEAALFIVSLSDSTDLWGKNLALYR